MLVEPILFGLLIGFLFKGDINRLIELKIKGVYLPFIAFTIEWVAGFFNERTLLHPLMTLGLQVVIYGLLLLFFISNRHIKGLLVVGAGVLLNGLVILANGGFMPVSATMAQLYGFSLTLGELQRGAIFGHKILLESDHLKFLSDVIRIPPPYWFPKTVSVGDVFMDVGLMMTIIKGMQRGK